jgi:hypothetical protein
MDQLFTTDPLSPNNRVGLEFPPRGIVVPCICRWFAALPSLLPQTLTHMWLLRRLAVSLKTIIRWEFGWWSVVLPKQIALWSCRDSGWRRHMRWGSQVSQVVWVHCEELPPWHCRILFVPNRSALAAGSKNREDLFWFVSIRASSCIGTPQACHVVKVVKVGEGWLSLQVEYKLAYTPVMICQCCRVAEWQSGSVANCYIISILWGWLCMLALRASPSGMHILLKIAIVSLSFEKNWFFP